jgi:hypothetical protein
MLSHPGMSLPTGRGKGTQPKFLQNSKGKGASTLTEELTTRLFRALTAERCWPALSAAVTHPCCMQPPRCMQPAWRVVRKQAPWLD